MLTMDLTTGWAYLIVSLMMHSNISIFSLFAVGWLDSADIDLLASCQCSVSQVRKYGEDFNTSLFQCCTPLLLLQHAYPSLQLHLVSQTRVSLFSYPMGEGLAATQLSEVGELIWNFLTKFWIFFTVLPPPSLSIPEFFRVAHFGGFWRFWFVLVIYLFDYFPPLTP